MKATIFALALAGAVSVASASSLTLYDTGVNSASLPLGPLGLDSHFTVPVWPIFNIVTPNAAVAFHGSPLWTANTATADWISAAQTSSGFLPGIDHAYGLYTYQEAFTVATAGAYNFTGDWAADNCGAIAVDGGSATMFSASGTTIGGGANATCSASLLNFENTTPFSFTVTLATGTNTLDFSVFNTGAPGDR